MSKKLSELEIILSKQEVVHNFRYLHKDAELSSNQFVSKIVVSITLSHSQISPTYATKKKKVKLGIFSEPRPGRNVGQILSRRKDIFMHARSWQQNRKISSI